ncbi:chromate efflux transporter [Frankia sp. CNm7]|uniref:Chromate efflux transporter n=1 Tax=Frankia nepalensis TaxID=1836974 RepID=A0A937RI20_9ACTN|nr:chromate efflux transporter [Frankia nepalensis]MBL7499452.1 chromate efflux transporter [Frankia nepalensis]MBL7511867.1 chromate efflux transporter [Frankia nepalensis]MBL7519509.1 chromate efflux transporter [Frankia nepalensis]MBL7629224.1 chromate efflux transporter [Frankia nepalensis]
MDPSPDAAATPARPSLGTLLREWGRIGCLGFGGPPTHIAMFRELCVEKRGWITAHEFEDAIAACNLLPGPASTQLSIYCAWRLRGRPGALVGGLAFIVPGLVAVLALSALFLAGSPPQWVRAAGAGAGAAVAAVAVHVGVGLLPASWRRAKAVSRPRWSLYLAAGVAGAATLGPWLVLLLIACGLVEVAARAAGPAGGAGTRRPAVTPMPVTPVPVSPAPVLALAAGAVAGGGLLALAWVALKVGLLSYGGGFVIIPLMQADAVDHYHWMTASQFLNAVSLGQVTPGPVVHTVAAVGYAAAGVGGGLLAAAVAFTPSFLFVVLGGPRFDRLRDNTRMRTFLDGAGPAALGAILGSAIPLVRALHEPWQFVVLAGAALLLLVARRGVVLTLFTAGAVGVVVVAAGATLPA